MINFVTSGEWYDGLTKPEQKQIQKLARHAASHSTVAPDKLTSQLSKLLNDRDSWIDNGHDPDLIASDIADKTPALYQFGHLRAQGYQEWEWHTVNDDRVDSDCRDRDGKVYPVGEEFRPAHVNCRCSCHPVGEIKIPDDDDD